MTRDDLLGGWLLIAHDLFQGYPSDFHSTQGLSGAIICFQYYSCTEGFRGSQQFGGVACRVQTSQVVNLTTTIRHLPKVYSDGLIG
jgi:hypothetical protein